MNILYIQQSRSDAAFDVKSPSHLNLATINGLKQGKKVYFRKI